jgi:hypothetical protein
MVRDRSTGRFVYTERLERRSGETSWEYVRRSVRREARIRTRFDGDATEVIVGWNVDSVEEFLRAHPEYRTDGDSDGGRGWEGTKGDWKEMPLTHEVLDKFSELITTALGLVASLARNTAIQNLFDTVFGGAGGKLAWQFVYTILITIVVVLAAISVARAAERAKRDEEDRK